MIFLENILYKNGLPLKKMNCKIVRSNYSKFVYDDSIKLICISVQINNRLNGIRNVRTEI